MKTRLFQVSVYHQVQLSVLYGRFVFHYQSTSTYSNWWYLSRVVQWINSEIFKQIRSFLVLKMKHSTLPLLWALPSSMFPLQGTKPGLFLPLQGKRCAREPRILKQCHSAGILKWSQFSQPFFFSVQFLRLKNSMRMEICLQCRLLPSSGFAKGVCGCVLFFRKLPGKFLKISTI